MTRGEDPTLPKGIRPFLKSQHVRGVRVGLEVGVGEAPP